MRFDGKVIIVTGGGGGIGSQLAVDLCAEGARVHILGRRVETLELTRERVRKLLGKQATIEAHCCDISNGAEVEACFAGIKNSSSHVHGLINNAGINPSRNDIENTSYRDWNQTLDVNLSGAFNCAKAAVSQMRESGSGSIVNISSIAGINGLLKRTAYSASKAGLVGLTRALALDYAKHGIRVNCICPGYIKTDLVSAYLGNLKPAEFDALVNAHPLRRIGQPQDVSKAVLFLLSTEASWITGAILPVDGGYSVGKEY